MSSAYIRSLNLSVVWLILSTTANACLPSGTDASIQAALAASPYTAELCQGAQFTITNGLVMNAGSRIYTTGYPTNDALKANLVLANSKIWPPSPTTFTIVDIRGNNTSLKNIKIDGNRANNTYYYHSPLVRLLASHVTIDHVTLQHATGLAALDAADNPWCTNLTITNNWIADNGNHLPGSAQEWANGIDIRCSNSYVANNGIRNATDGAITFYGGTNTVIEYNWISNASQSAFSGIALAAVFNNPTSYAGSYVRNNLIETCCGQHIHAAIAVGTHAWCHMGSADCNYVQGANVINNSGSGTFGFGIYLGGATSVNVAGNNLTTSLYYGMLCGPAFYVMDVDAVSGAHHATGTLQPGYTTASLHWPCIAAGGE